MKAIAKLMTASFALGLGLALAGCNDSGTVSKQTGPAGTGMVKINSVARLDKIDARNQLPDPIDPVEKSGTPASKAYQNVQVLGSLDENEFLRLMTAITQWVSPEQGCNYCHNPENLASDDIYTKVVARRMLQMTQHINVNWTQHVAQTGVTCWTCHRGQPVPANIWFSGPVADARGMLGYSPWQKNHPGALVNLSSLPNDPFTSLINYSNEIRIISETALPTGQPTPPIRQTDVTYALMLHMSESLGVNCTFCHNTRSFFAWDQSTPQRATAWYGIRTVRDLNQNYLAPLTGVFPPIRLGPNGDVAKINCATCHQNQPKPLAGVSMLKTWPELATITGPTAITTPKK